ncbi:hypothetical protein KA082_01680 [Candidatus Woesebacteria bacterium]|nr:hypothetical protein [Candidatus Woesebacteria bacterium]
MFALVQKAYALGNCSDTDIGKAEVDLGRVLCLGDSTPVQDVYKDPAFLVNLLVRNLFVFAGVIIFFLILYAGFKFISGGTKGKDEAKGIVTASVTGLILMFAAYWILQVVKLLTGVDVGL